MLEKKTFEISNIESVDELNSLCIALNEKEQVSHMKVYKESIVFNCIDIEALLNVISSINKSFVVKEVIDGKKRQYDFTNRKETKHYFMFRNMMIEDDILLLVQRLKESEKYKDVSYDKANKILMLVSDKKDVLSYLRKELFKINPSIEIFEHHKPIRSQDVFQQKFINSYIRIAIFLVAASLGLIMNKDHSIFTPFFWMIAMFVLAEPVLKEALAHIKQHQFLNQSVLMVIAFIMGICAKTYIEICIAVIVYRLLPPILSKVLDRALNKIDEAVQIPETALELDGEETKEKSLYDFEVGDILVVHSGETVHIPGQVVNGHSQMSTYSNTSTYDLVDVKKGSHVDSGDINVGDESLYIRVEKPYESSRFMKLMNIASVAPIYESKIEKYTKILSRFYTPAVVILGLVLGVIFPVVNYEEYSSLIHIGCVLLAISGAFYSEQSTSLGMLAGFAKAFQNGIIIESSLGLDSINATQTIIYDRFDGVEVNEEELDLFKKLAHIGRTFVVFNDGPVALEDDQYIIFNDLTVQEKLNKMDAYAGPTVYIGDSFKDIELLQKSYVGISRGGLSDPKVVENSDIVLIDSSLQKVYETFVIARRMRTLAILNNAIAIITKLLIMITIATFFPLPLWAVILIEGFVTSLVVHNSTLIL